MSALGNKQVFAKNLRYYLDRHGKNQKEISIILGISPSTLNAWAKAKKYPRIDRIEQLANYFGILKSDLIEEKTETQRKIQQKNDTLSDIILRLNSDAEFFSLVKSLYKLDAKKISSLRAFLK